MPDPWREKYPALSSTFFRGTLLGQIRSAHSARHAQPEKVVDFKKAIEAGDVILDVSKILNRDVAKLTALGIEIPAASAQGPETPQDATTASSEEEPTADTSAEPDDEVKI